MKALFDEASDRAVLGAFHRRGSETLQAPLQLRLLRQSWSDTGLRTNDLPIALNRLIDDRLLEACITDDGPALLLTQSGAREVDESFGRGSTRGEDWMAEITLCMVRHRGDRGQMPAVERRAA